LIVRFPAAADLEDYHAPGGEARVLVAAGIRRNAVINSLFRIDDAVSTWIYTPGGVSLIITHLKRLILCPKKHSLQRAESL